MRRSWYWQEYDDDDLWSLLKNHERLILISEYEIKRIRQELKERRLFDQVGEVT